MASSRRSMALPPTRGNADAGSYGFLPCVIGLLILQSRAGKSHTIVAMPWIVQS